MLQDTTRELARAASFLRLTPTTELLDRAIANSSAERLREMEKRQGDQWIANKNHRKDIPFVGAAAAGGWRTRLPKASVLQIETAWGGLMNSLGYSLVSSGAPERELGVTSAASR
jgi:hypothetical protein